MKIYLADLFHNNEGVLNPDALPYTVPLGIGYLAASIKSELPKADVLLFRDVDDLLDALKSPPPLLLGFTLRSWNSDLTTRAIALVTRCHPDLPIVVGGPSVHDDDNALRQLLAAHPGVRYAIPSEGEHALLSLVHHLTRARTPNTPLPGVGYLDDNGRLIRTEHRACSLDSIPSPYLTGVLDRFLEAGMVPLIQSMRGCPYRCTFCASGGSATGKLRVFPLERVEAEIDYALSHTQTGDMILTDENWGILGERDVQCAHIIMKQHAATRRPTRLYYYTAKMLTDSVRRIAEIVSPIAWIGQFTMSLQTLNVDSRDAVSRTNAPIARVADNVKWARERNITTLSEMIYGFPYETPDTFIEGVETLMDVGIDQVLVYPLQLFPGIELNSEHERRRNGLSTRFRLADGCFGVYQNGDLLSVETEEVVVSTKWSGVDGFQRVRRYSLFLMLMFGRGYFREFARLADAAGLRIAPIPAHLTESQWESQPHMRCLLEDYAADARAELHPTREAVYRFVQERFTCGEEIGGAKLNLIYLGKLMSSQDAIRELLDSVTGFVRKNASDNPALPVLEAYLRDVLPVRADPLNRNTPATVTFQARFDYDKWATAGFGSGDELLLDTAAAFEATISPSALHRIRQLDCDRSAELQEFYDKTPCEELLRTVSRKHSREAAHYGCEVDADVGRRREPVHVE